MIRNYVWWLRTIKSNEPRLRRLKKFWEGGQEFSQWHTLPFQTFSSWYQLSACTLWTNVTNPGLSHYLTHTAASHWLSSNPGLLLLAKVSGGQAGTFWARRDVSDWGSRFEVFPSWRCCSLKLWGPREGNSITADIKERRYSVSVIAPSKETDKKTRKSPCSLSVADFPVAGAKLLGKKAVG